MKRGHGDHRGTRGAAKRKRAQRGAFWAAVMAVVVVTIGMAAPAQAQNERVAFEAANSMLASWQMGEAEKAIAAFSTISNRAPYLNYLEGRYAFYSGDYDEALTKLDAAVEEVDRQDWQQFRDIVANTVEITDGYERHVSPSGKFEIWVEPGPDEALIPYAIEALEEAYDELGEILDYRPDEPVRVEVYPRATILADVSMLTEENIRTSGTIALCQYNRLMITSPRGVLRGYSWVDTLIHEYIHLMINQRNVETVPIWMHEGLAKYLERRWRGDRESTLDASSEHLLKKRLEDNNLVAFDDMHPSMAMLPSQEDAAVAFAQVFTTMEYLEKQLGDDAFARLLDAVDEGLESREAYAHVLGTTWDEFENYRWRNYLHRRSTPDLPDDPDAIYQEEVVLQDEAGAAPSELDQVEKPEARKHMELGQMFQVRERWGAAAVQYGKAQALMGDSNPVLQTRKAKSLTKSGNPERAVEILQTVKDLHPGHVATWRELGRAHLMAHEYSEAREALREAARINPFDPEIHRMLARAADELDLSDEAEVARQSVDLVRR